MPDVENNRATWKWHFQIREKNIGDDSDSTSAVQLAKLAAEAHTMVKKRAAKNIEILISAYEVSFLFAQIRLFLVFRASASTFA